MSVIRYVFMSEFTAGKQAEGIRMTVKPHTPVLGLAALLCGQAAAATFTVSFDPATPALTNGWIFGQTSELASTSATQPGGRRFAPKNAGDTLSIESPVFAADIRAVALSAWGNGINTGNASRVAVFGRANAAADYVELFSRTGLDNTLAKNEPEDTFNVPDGFVCRQLKIAYTKDIGTWILAKVTITDDAVRAAPPTNLRAETTDADARRVRVTWDMPSGVTESECRTFTTTATGGLAAVPAEGLLWRKSFADVPAAKTTRLLTADAFAALGFAGWEAETVRQTTVAGALLIGWEKHASGSLATPPLGVDIPEGSTLVLRAAKHETKTGILPVYTLVGGATSCVASVAIDSTPRDYPIPLPALAAADRLLVHSATNTASEKTLVYDLAICTPDAYVAEGVATNAPGDVQTLSGNAAELVVPTDGTNLYLEVRTRLGTDVSDWTPPFPVTLATSGTGDDAGGEAGDDDPTPTPDGLAAPSRIRAGRLKNGALRLGWDPPAGATNVQIRIWSRTASGGLAETAADDILWRETFAAAPATNSTITLNTADKWNRYADQGAGGWAWEACTAVYLASVAGALRIGKSDGVGRLVTRPLEQAGEVLTLVVTARRAVTSAGTDLHAALVTADGTTNALAEATLTDEFEEYAWPLALAPGASIVLGSPTKKKDGRMLVSDIALVRSSYTPVAFATNDCLSADLGPVATFDWTPPGEHLHFVSLRAQDADGRESPWSEAFVLDPTILEDWHDRHVTMTDETLDVLFRPEELPKTETGHDASACPFRFLLQGEEVGELRNRDATKQLSTGVYVCTNVFTRDWAVLVPRAPDNAADVRDAELRLAIQTGDYAARRLEVSGTFAQLNATNTQEKALLIQWRQTAPDGAATDWQTLADYTSTYTATNAAPALAETETEVAGAVDFRAPRGATVETRVYCRKANDSGREAPLGFRDFRVRVCGKGPSLLFIVR